ncbi:MAG: aldose 1-epimerase [Betaproteobacteria bacterium]
MAMTPRIELSAGAARAILLPRTGGAVGGFTWRDVDVLRPMPGDGTADDNVRLAACYPLLPYSNRIRDAVLTVGGERHVLRRNFGDHPNSIHGIGWQNAWRVEHADAANARLAFAHDARGDAQASWPWPFEAMQAFGLRDDGAHATLELTLTLRNTGARAFPFGLGWHPYLPKPASATLQFAADGVWLNDATQLPVTREAVPPAWNFASSRAIGEVALDNVFTGWRGVARLASPASARTMTVEADAACACLVVYAPPGRDFIALEPVTHETDAFNRAEAGATATGTRWLPPGAAFSCTMRISSAHSPAT